MHHQLPFADECSIAVWILAHKAWHGSVRPRVDCGTRDPRKHRFAASATQREHQFRIRYVLEGFLGGGRRRRSHERVPLCVSAEVFCLRELRAAFWVLTGELVPGMRQYVTTNVVWRDRLLANVACFRFPSRAAAWDFKDSLLIIQVDCFRWIGHLTNEVKV